MPLASCDEGGKASLITAIRREKMALKCKRQKKVKNLNVKELAAIVGGGVYGPILTT